MLILVCMHIPLYGVTYENGMCVHMCSSMCACVHVCDLSFWNIYAAGNMSPKVTEFIT